MAIDLAGLPIARAVPTPVRLGGVVRGSLGGSQRIERLGSRWAFTFETAPMRIEPAGREWAALLDRGVREGVIVAVRQPDFFLAPGGAPTVRAGTAPGKLLPLSGLAANVSIVAGQWLSVIVGGRRYLDRTAIAAQANGNGETTLTLVNLIRVAMPAGAVVEMIAPRIEGSIEGDIGEAWEPNRCTSFSFTVVEDE